MNKTLLLLKYKVIQSYRKLIEWKNEPLLKKLVISSFIFGYLFGGFYLMYRFFWFVNSITPIGAVVVVYLVWVLLKRNW